MAFYALTMTHPALVHPVLKEAFQKINDEAVRKKEEASRKCGVKVLVSSAAIPEHILFYVVEAPSPAAVQDYLKEAGIGYVKNLQIRQVRLGEEALTLSAVVQ